ncbi:MAG: class I SAM-dependent methyltransferase, partial [bacterium]|nr:class I SAM-dependent methyltransferase [bacterium]MDW8164081.1 CmcI family methyltransferase [Candidatus Omnitrophota bacterium]
KKLTHSILEIGLGYYGGTHILWRLIFNKVITIEIDIKNIKRFVMNETISFRDIFIIGNSQDPKIFKKTKKILRNINQVDVLFIDGDHSYESVKNDYFIYRKLVKKGGIIAFHDSFCTLEEIGFGVNRFLKELQEGLIDGKRHIINNIVFSQAVGISWEEKE